MHPSEISIPPREAEARRRWASAALLSSALLIIPLVAWLALPVPSSPPLPSRARGAQEDEAPEPAAPAVVPARTPPARAARVAPPPQAEPAEAPRPTALSAAGIAGKVVDEKGAPVMSYWIGVDAFAPAGGGDAGAMGALKRRIDDVEGAFELTDLAPGRYELVVSVVSGPLSRSQSIDVTQGTVTRGVRLVIHPGVTVTGTVTDAATHAPLDGARAFVSMGALASQQPRTRGGQFSIDEAPAEPFDLVVTCPGYVPKTVRGLQGRPGGPPLHVDVALDRLVGIP